MVCRVLQERPGMTCSDNKMSLWTCVRPAKCSFL